MRLKDVVEKWAEFVRRLALHHYGKAPAIRLSGHVGSTFPYITVPLDYILPELFKVALFVRSLFPFHCHRLVYRVYRFEVNFVAVVALCLDLIPEICELQTQLKSD